MQQVLETERLRLRELNFDDCEFIIKLLNTSGWLKYIGDKDVKTYDQARSYLNNGPLKSYSVNGYGLWLVEKKEGSVAIGICGIIKRDILENPDIGFAYLPEFMKKGYALEAAQATIDYAKAKLKIPELSAIVMPTNNSSIKLLEKLGFKAVKTIPSPDLKTELLLYVLI